MEQESIRLVDNAPGRYYIDSRCNNCGICSLFGNSNFVESHSQTYHYVMQQPVDAFEEIAIRKAMVACPMKSIRDDGRHWN